MCFTQTSPTRINHSFCLGEAVALCNHGGNANHPKLAYSAVYKLEHKSLSFPPTQALDRMPHPRMKAKNLRLGLIRSMFQKQRDSEGTDTHLQGWVTFGQSYTVITSNFQQWGINTLWAYKPHHMHNYLSQVSSKLAFISEARGL